MPDLFARFFRQVVESEDQVNARFERAVCSSGAVRCQDLHTLVILEQAEED